MSFITNRDLRGYAQENSAWGGQVYSTDDEVFDASLGFVIDEAHSTSRLYNNELKAERSKRFTDLVTSGQIRREDYQNRSGAIDWKALSSQYEDIQSDEELFQQKSEMLKSRRQYVEQVIDMSDSGTSEFLGSMTGYAVDPVNLVSMPVSLPFAVTKSAGFLVNALRAGASAGIVNAGTEALIQPMVLDYKADLDSPYSTQDAITAIGTAAVGGAVLGGVAGGVSGWLRGIKERFDLDRQKNFLIDEHVRLRGSTYDEAMRIIDEGIETLESNPNKFNSDDAKAKFIAEKIDEGQKLSGAKLPEQQAADLAEYMDELANGNIPKALEKEFSEFVAEANVKHDLDFLDSLEAKRAELNQPTVKAEDFKPLDEVNLERRIQEQVSKVRETFTDKLNKVKESILSEAKIELAALAGNKMSRAEKQKLMYEKKDLEYKLSQLEEPKKPKQNASRAAKNKYKEDVEFHSQQKQNIEDMLQRANSRLDADKKAASANRKLTQIENGKIPSEYQKRINVIGAELDNEFGTISQRIRDDITATNREAATRQAGDGINLRNEETAKKMEDVEGMSKLLDEMDNPVVVREDGELVPAQQLIDEYDVDIDRIKGLEVCLSA